MLVRASLQPTEHPELRKYYWSYGLLLAVGSPIWNQIWGSGNKENGALDRTVELRRCIGQWLSSLLHRCKTAKFRCAEMPSHESITDVISCCIMKRKYEGVETVHDYHHYQMMLRVNNSLYTNQKFWEVLPA